MYGEAGHAAAAECPSASAAVSRIEAPVSMAIDLRVWRHPKPVGAVGRCIGRTDLHVDARRATRLAHRVLMAARREGLPREIWTSPLARCADVGRILARRGRFVHRIDARLAELDFGRWDGRPWTAIAPAEVAIWEADFALTAPGGGEALVDLVRRARDFLLERAAAEPATVLVIGHAGWINAACHLRGPLPRADEWPSPIAYASPIRLRLRL